MRALIVLLMIFVAAPAFAQTTSPAPGLPPSGERAAIATLLSAAHELPPREQFAARASDPRLVLRSIADGRGPIAERAVEAMFMWPDDRTFAFAQEQLSSDAIPRGRRNRLLLLIAGTFGERAVPTIVAHLSHDDRQVRITAAAAAALTESPVALDALEVAIASEEEQATAREMLRRASVRQAQ